jgi:acyl-CoA dehydrogenase
MGTVLFELVVLVVWFLLSIDALLLAFHFLRKTWMQLTAAAAALFVLLGAYDWASALPEAFHAAIALIYLLLLATFMIGPLRRLALMRPMLRYFRSVLPPLSDTEQAAIDAGTVSWERQIFSGDPDWRELESLPAPSLSEEERAFLDGPVEQACAMIDDWKISQEDYDLPPELWTFLRENGFFGMILPRAYGGLEFSAYAHSCVVLKMASRSIPVGVTTMVPNSLGPGLLLLEYGTEQQRDYYLPRLASGEEVPCFALTEPQAGSDAAGMTSHGVVCKREVDGEEVLGIELNWSKRYITLAPVATLLGLAFKLYDPDRLLGDKEELGISVALIPTSTPGIEIGARHMPLNTPFMNGPVRGADVFIPVDHLIGGAERAGQGWRMLMECLSDGRGISLPSLSAAAGKSCCSFTGAYARVRKQFNAAIGDFEGIQEALASIVGNTYLMDAVRSMTAATVDAGEKPAVASAIAKYHLTERMRDVVNSAVDIHGGSAICMGPRNPLGRTYQAIPISITVEGANMVTRNLIIFGQGSVRAHPWVLKEMEAANEENRRKGLRDFDAAICGHAIMFISNWARSSLGSVSLTAFGQKAVNSRASEHYRKLAHLSARFAVMSDLAMLRYGGALKRFEFYSALLADLFSALYIGSAALKHFENRGASEDDMPLLDWVMQDCYDNFNRAAGDILANRPWGGLTPAIKFMLYPLGIPAVHRDRKREKQLANIVTNSSPLRESLIEGIYRAKDQDDIAARMEKAFDTVQRAREVERKFRKLENTLDSWDVDFDGQLKEALEKSLLSQEEVDLLKEAQAQRLDIIQVDEFAADYWKPRISGGDTA